jgi:hypothetical protein
MTIMSCRCVIGGTMDQVFWIAAALTIIIVSVAAGHTAYKETW